MSLSLISCRVYSLAISTLLCTILLTTVSHPQAEAQVVNQRVRVTYNSGSIYTGRIAERSDSLLVVQDEISRQNHSLSFADMQAIAVSQGIRSYPATGLLVGFAGGFLTAAIFCDGCGFLGNLLVAGIGAPLGRTLGRTIKREAWATIPIPGQTALRVEPLLGVDLASRPVIGVRLKL